MAASFFFYDLETSGFSPSEARIMQFAGQRTDMELKPVGEPVNVLIRLSADVLPDPEAVLLTGITPQATIQDGLTEAEFLRFFYDQVVQPDTSFLGYNSVRFDDEFMRYLHYRNFYDAYEWQWGDGCSRWDLLDVARATRALRPEGIEWPFTDDGKPTNRLELLTKLNGLDHYKSHDALSDVRATIAVARLIRTKQPDLFQYMFDSRHKKVVSELVLKGLPFTYVSGRYPSPTLHTSAAVLLVQHPQSDGALVYDLRHDPTPFFNLTVEELVERWQYTKDEKAPPRLPVKTLKYNRCPAVAPLGVMNTPATLKRLQVDMDGIKKHWEILKLNRQPFATKILQALEQMDDDRERQRARIAKTVDTKLYDGFFGGTDKQALRTVRSASPEQLSTLQDKLQDERLKQLLPLYKARNYPRQLSSDEREKWDAYLRDRLLGGGQGSRLATYFQRLQRLAQGPLTSEQQFLVRELQLYGEAIMPFEPQ